MNADYAHLVSPRRNCDECCASDLCRAAVLRLAATFCENDQAQSQRKKKRKSDKVEALREWLESEQPHRVNVKGICARFGCGHTATHKYLTHGGYVYEPTIGGEKGWWRRAE